MRRYMLAIVIIAFFTLTPITQADNLFSSEDQLIIDTSELLLQSIVRISPGVGDHGSGFYVDATKILTNYHVIKNSPTVTIETRAGQRCAAKVLYQEWNPDLALLETECEGPPLQLYAPSAIGQTVLAAGHPGIYKFVVTKGIISGSKWDMLQFDARVATGSSGGPLANTKGQVIGVVSAKDKQIDYISFAISTKEVNKFLERAK